MPTFFHLAQRRQQLVGHGRALQAFADIALHGYGEVALSRHITPGSPDHDGLGDLGQRNGLTSASGHIDVGNIGNRIAILLGGRMTISISLSPSRYWPTVVPENCMLVASAID